MNSRKTIAFTLLLAALFFVGGTLPAHAVIRIYKVSFSAKALLFPGNNFLDTGYVIYDTVTPGNSATVQLFKNKTYHINGLMLGAIAPDQIAFGTLDRNGDTFIDTEFATVGFSSGGLFHSRGYMGTVPKAGFRVGAITVFGTAKSLKGRGSVANIGVDQFAISDTWTFDNLSVTGNPGDVAAGVLVVQAVLASKGFTQI